MDGWMDLEDLPFSLRSTTFRNVLCIGEQVNSHKCRTKFARQEGHRPRKLAAILMFWFKISTYIGGCIGFLMESERERDGEWWNPIFKGLFLQDLLPVFHCNRNRWNYSPTWNHIVSWVSPDLRWTWVSVLHRKDNISDGVLRWRKRHTKYISKNNNNSTTTNN